VWIVVKLSSQEENLYTKRLKIASVNMIIETIVALYIIIGSCIAVALSAMAEDTK